GFLAISRANKKVDDVEVVFVAAVLVQLLGGIDLVPRNERGPWPGPRRRILDGELVVERRRVDAREALGDLERRRIRALKHHAVVGPEVRRLDDERGPVTVAAGVAEPLTKAAAQMG